MREIIAVGVLAIVCGLVSPVTAEGTAQSAGHEEAAAPTQSRDKVEINTADRMELEELPGIGPRTAERIIEYRTENGRFEKIEELMNVRGIGERTFLRLRDLVQVSSTSDPQ